MVVLSRQKSLRWEAMISDGLFMVSWYHPCCFFCSFFVHDKSVWPYRLHSYCCAANRACNNKNKKVPGRIYTHTHIHTYLLEFRIALYFLVYKQLRERNGCSMVSANSVRDATATENSFVLRSVLIALTCCCGGDRTARTSKFMICTTATASFCRSDSIAPCIAPCLLHPSKYIPGTRYIASLRCDFPTRKMPFFY